MSRAELPLHRQEWQHDSEAPFWHLYWDLIEAGERTGGVFDCLSFYDFIGMMYKFSSDPPALHEREDEVLSEESLCDFEQEGDEPAAVAAATDLT